MTRSSLVPTFLSALAAGLLLAAPAHATPLTYSTGLANPATTIDFSGLADGTVVGSAYAAQGVVFGGLYVNSSQGNTLTPTTAPAAANFLGNVTNRTFTISFSTAVSDAAFFFYTNDTGSTITSSLGGTTVETIAAGKYNNGDSFFGFQNSSFDAITVTIGGTGLALIDNVELGSVNVSAVPEPASMAMLGIGMAGLLAARRRRA